MKAIYINDDLHRSERDGMSPPCFLVYLFPRYAFTNFTFVS
jgi:hypothetical protein